ARDERRVHASDVLGCVFHRFAKRLLQGLERVSAAVAWHFERGQRHAIELAVALPPNARDDLAGPGRDGAIARGPALEKHAKVVSLERFHIPYKPKQP